MTVLLFILNFDPVTFTSRKVFYGLTKDFILINRQKSGFYKRSAAFVGYLIEKGTVKRCTHKTGEKVNCPVPKNKEVLRFILMRSRVFQEIYSRFNSKL